MVSQMKIQTLYMTLTNITSLEYTRYDQQEKGIFFSVTLFLDWIGFGVEY